MQVDHLVEAHGSEPADQVAQVLAQLVHMVHMRVEAHQVGEGGLRGHVHLGPRQLLLQAAQHRAGEHDVADGGEAEDEQFHGRPKVPARAHRW